MPVHSRRAAYAGAVALAAAVVPITVAASAAPAAPAGGGTGSGSASYIVTLDSGDPATAAERARTRHGAEVAHVYRHALRGYAARMSAKAAAETAQEPGVEDVLPDRPMSIAAQSLPTGINRIDGELSPAVSGNGSGVVDVDVAVIDTGIAAHPDLRIAGGKNCSTGSSYSDGHGHGTHVAGTIAAKDDASGVVGVVPGARLWAVRVLDNRGSGTFSSIICGIDWVTARSSTIEVANMSLGGDGSDRGGCVSGDAMHRAVCRSVSAGVTYTVAAGNESDDARNHVPAAYDEVITVSALADFNGRPGGGAAATCRSDVDDTFANFSNHGADVDLIAPGVCIRSTWRNGGFNTISGTSMAAPHAAGAAALYKVGVPSATPAAVKTALQSAGNSYWNNADDRDATKEPLLNVDEF